MTLQTGTALAGLRRYGRPSINTVYRGDVLLSDGTIVRGFLKDLDPRQLGNELLVAAIAQKLGVMAPSVAVVKIDNAITRDFSKIPHRLGGHIAFFSIDADGQTVAQIIEGGTPSYEIMQFVKKSPAMGRMYGIDTWVANVDRHKNNLILRGDGTVVLIDHGHCITGPEWRAADLNSAKEYVCKLKGWLTPLLTSEEKDAAMADIRALSIKMMSTDVQALVEDYMLSSLYGDNDCDAVVGFLEARSAHVLPLGETYLETL